MKQAPEVDWEQAIPVIDWIEVPVVDYVQALVADSVVTPETDLMDLTEDAGYYFTMVIVDLVALAMEPVRERSRGQVYQVPKVIMRMHDPHSFVNSITASTLD